MATLSVVTNTSTEISIKTSDYASGFGDFYVFWSAAYAASHTNRMGECGLAQWYHGAAGYLATGSETDNADTTQVSAGWDSTNGIGGLHNAMLGSALACSGTGSAFAVVDTANTCMMSVHLAGPSATTQEAKFWNIWANGIHVNAMKNRLAKTAGNLGFGSAFHSSYGSMVTHGTDGGEWGFNGTHVGVYIATNWPQPENAINTGSGSDGHTTTRINAFNQATIAAGSKPMGRICLNGHDNAITSTLAQEFSYDMFIGVGGFTLTVTTGTKTTSGTDQFGNSATWTDGFDTARSAYIIAAASNHVNLGGTTAAKWSIDNSLITRRFRPCYIITGWTSSINPPTVTLGGTTQVKGTDFESYIDTTNHILYLCLLFDITGSFGALDITIGTSGTNTPKTLTGAFSPAGTMSLDTGHKLSASISPAGTMLRSTGHALVASFTPTGTAVKKTGKVVLASVSPAGNTTSIAGHVTTLTGSVSPAGTMLRSTGKILSASFTPVGALVRAVSHFLAGSVSPSGAMTKAGTHTDSASISPAGTLFRNTGHRLSGAFSPSGVITHIASYLRTLSGALTMAGTLTSLTAYRRTLSGLLTFTGTLSNASLFFKALSAAISPAGAMLRAVSTHLSGFTSPSGSMLRSTSHTTSASLSPVGTLTRNVAHGLAGLLTFAGTLTHGAGHFLTLTASLTPVGTLVRSVGHTLAGAFGPSGTMSRTTSHIVSAAITPTGNIVRTISKLLSGQLTFAGVVAGVLNSGAQQFAKTLTASLTMAGSLVRVTGKPISAALTMGGSLMRSTSRVLSASLTLGGIINTGRATLKTLTASISPSGTLRLNITKVLAGTLTFSATMGKNCLHQMASVLQSAGALTKMTSTHLNASLTPNGLIASGRGLFKTLSGAVGLAGSLVRGSRITLAGGLPIAGALTRHNFIGLATTLQMLGTLRKRTATTLVPAVLSFSGHVVGSFRQAGLDIRHLFATFTDRITGLFGRLTNDAGSLYGTLEDAPDDLHGMLQ